MRLLPRWRNTAISAAAVAVLSKRGSPRLRRPATAILGQRRKASSDPRGDGLSRPGSIARRDAAPSTAAAVSFSLGTARRLLSLIPCQGVIAQSDSPFFYAVHRIKERCPTTIR